MNRVGIRVLAAAAVLAAGALVFQAPGAQRRPDAAPITIDYPENGSIFPPDFAAPTFLWRDPDESASEWRIEIAFADGARAIRVKSQGERMRVGEIDPECVAPTNEPPKLTPEQAAAHTWKPDEAVWAAVGKHSVKRPATITITGLRGGRQAVSRGRVTIQTSRDPVGAPVFYRDVPLMPSELEKGIIKPLAPNAIPLIAWRLRNVGETSSRLLMKGLHTCANCHSVSTDGKTLGMDVDGPQNDKGLYAIVPIRPETSIRNENVIAWSTFRGKLGGRLRVGFMPQISPDGRYVITTINDPGAEQTEIERRKRPNDLIGNYYVSNFKDYRFLQVFYPTRGILAWYDRESRTLKPLPGADDPRYVHANAAWSPDGKYLVFIRAEAREAYPPGAKPAERSNGPNETQIRYDLYRIPFNGGKGGVAEPVEGASDNGRSNNFPKISPDGKWIVFVQCRNGELMRPDSELYIVPFEGGRARRMRCNTPLMNSWHSFSPNGRWLVFSSKSRSPYTQMYLTHIDDNGEDSPAILVENATAANRAVNIPEFINVPPDYLVKMDAPVTDFYRVFDQAAALAEKGRYKEAIPEWRKALELNPGDERVYTSLGVALYETSSVEEAIAQYRKAIEISPGYPEARISLGSALAGMGRLDEAIPQFEKALELDASNAKAHSNLGGALAEKGRLAEAILHYEEALRINPDYAEAHNNLGIALARSGRLDEAVQELEKAVAGSPGSFDFEYNLGRVLAARHSFLAAVPHFEKAAELSGGREPAVLDMLAAMYAEVGRYPDAVQAARRALALAASQHNQRLAEGVRARLAMYESKVAAQPVPRLAPE